MAVQSCLALENLPSTISFASKPGLNQFASQLGAKKGRSRKNLELVKPLKLLFCRIINCKKRSNYNTKQERLDRLMVSESTVTFMPTNMLCIFLTEATRRNPCTSEDRSAPRNHSPFSSQAPAAELNMLNLLATGF